MLRELFIEAWGKDKEDRMVFPTQSVALSYDDCMEEDEVEVEPLVLQQQVLERETSPRQNKKRALAAPSSLRRGKLRRRVRQRVIPFNEGAYVMAKYRYDDGTYAEYSYAKVTAVHGSKRDLLYSDGHTEQSKTLTFIRNATKGEKVCIEKLIWMQPRTVDVELHGIQQGENPDSFRVWDKDGEEYSFENSQLNVSKNHIDWCRANPSIKLYINETNVDYDGSIKMLQYRGEGELWSVWNDRDVMYWTESTLISKSGDALSIKIQECKANPNVRLDTPGARGKLETSLALSTALRGCDGGSATGVLRFKQASGGHCVLNSICNALPESHSIADDFYQDLYALGERCSFSTLLDTVSADKRATFYVKKIKSDGSLLVILRRSVKTSGDIHIEQKGMYAFKDEVGGHCYTWDANKKVIIDTDPKHAQPLDISTSALMEETLRVLGIKTISMLYQIIPRPLK